MFQDHTLSGVITSVQYFIILIFSYSQQFHRKGAIPSGEEKHITRKGTKGRNHAQRKLGATRPVTEAPLEFNHFPVISLKSQALLLHALRKHPMRLCPYPHYPYFIKI